MSCMAEGGFSASIGRCRDVCVHVGFYELFYLNCDFVTCIKFLLVIS